MKWKSTKVLVYRSIFWLSITYHIILKSVSGLVTKVSRVLGPDFDGTGFLQLARAQREVGAGIVLLRAAEFNTHGDLSSAALLTLRSWPIPPLVLHVCGWVDVCVFVVTVWTLAGLSAKSVIFRGHFSSYLMRAGVRDWPHSPHFPCGISLPNVILFLT